VDVKTLIMMTIHSGYCMVTNSPVSMKISSLTLQDSAEFLAEVFDFVIIARSL
jgi:hypothetical protein